MLDADLAELYGVSTKRLNEQVKRNRKRFPADFVFPLTSDEVRELNRSQFATGSQKHRDPRFPPYAFTEHGALAASFVLSTPLAVEMSIQVVRTFVRLREAFASHVLLAQALRALEDQVHAVDKKHDRRFKNLLREIRKLMTPPDPEKRGQIGFIRREEE